MVISYFFHLILVPLGDRVLFAHFHPAPPHIPWQKTPIPLREEPQRQ